jgi:hypothetical protein
MITSRSAGGAFPDVGRDHLAIQRRLMFIRRQHHHDIGLRNRIGQIGHREPGLLGLGGGRRSRPQPHHDIDARILEVVGMGMALRAITQDGDLAGLDQGQIGIFVVVHVDHG